MEVARAVIVAGGQALVFSAGGRLVDDLTALGATHINGPAKSKNPWTDFVTNVARLQRIIATYDVDLVHARSRAPAWSALIAARRMGKPFVTTYHGIYSAKSRLKTWYNSVMARGDRVIANSRFTRNHVISTHGTKPEKVTVIYRGVDVEAFDASAVTPERRAALAAAWGVSEMSDTLRLILPARLTVWKGQRVFIEALGLLKARGLGFEAFLVGDAHGRDAYVGALHQAISDLGLTGHVHLVGHCRDMPAAFSLCDIAVTPSIEAEAFGRTAAEAQAMGLPIVASRAAGFVETVAEGVTGLLVEPGSATALAGALETLLRAPKADRLAMGAAGKQRISALFTAQSLQTATLALYQQLLAERP